MRCSPRVQFSLVLLVASALCLRSFLFVAFRRTSLQPPADCNDGSDSITGVAQLDRDEARRVAAQCGGATWQEEYAALHASIRSAQAPPHGSKQGRAAQGGAGQGGAEHGRFLTFTCTPGICGGIGDLLIGLVSAFVVALMQDRALIIDYAHMDMAFEPASPRVDWRLRSDIPLGPEIPPPKDPSRRRALPPDSVVYLNMHNLDLPADVAEYFDSLATAANIRLVLNRGILVELFDGDKAGTRAWRDVLVSKGFRLPSAFGCILRFLIKPKAELLRMVTPYLQQLHPPSGPHTATAALGLHIRTSDARTWRVEKVGEKPKLRVENVAAELRGARTLFSCAQTLEQFFFGPGVRVRWLLFSSSQALKQAAASLHGDKVMITDINPMHIELKGSDADRANAFRTTAAEWLLLSRCCSLYLFTESGFSKTAALYSLQPLSMYMFGRWADSWRDASWKDKCVPEEPTRIAVMGNTTRWSGI